jgi:hypothetical protein
VAVRGVMDQKALRTMMPGTRPGICVFTIALSRPTLQA